MTLLQPSHRGRRPLVMRSARCGLPFARATVTRARWRLPSGRIKSAASALPMTPSARAALRPAVARRTISRCEWPHRFRSAKMGLVLSCQIEGANCKFASRERPPFIPVPWLQAAESCRQGWSRTSEALLGTTAENSQVLSKVTRSKASDADLTPAEL